MSDLNGMLESAMKDPRFADILSSLKEKADKGELNVEELLGGMTKDEKNEAQSAPGIVPASKKVGMDSHKKLLSALRPYLADPKREAVDEILKISEFSGIIEALKGAQKNGGR